MNKFVLLFILVSYTAFNCTGSKVCKVKHFIGESFGGGIVFYIDKTGCHGLIAPKEDQGKNLTWWNGSFKNIGATADGLYAGANNTKLIMAENLPGQFAARACAEYSITQNGILYDDWYLPSRYELNLLYIERNTVGFVLDAQYSSYYWSSTETDISNSVAQEFHFGTPLINSGKGNNNCVRAVRSF